MGSAVAADTLGVIVQFLNDAVDPKVITSIIWALLKDPPSYAVAPVECNTAIKL